MSQGLGAILTFQRYLTDVENRLQILENALGKLFPSGELDDVTRSLLADETPRDQDSLTQSFIDTNESTLKDFLQEPGPTALENALDDSQINTDYDLTGVGPEGQHLSLEAFSSKDNSPNDLLASAEKEKEFADTYFSRYHKLYPFVHEATFRLEFQDRLLSPSSQSVLANMILAFGSWLAPENHSDLGVQYYRKAQQHLGQIALTDNESITMVQALLLLSDFAQKNGDPDESWQYVATAVRKAISLNLHVELTDPGLTALDREIRRRIWWATYCAESCSARIYGRPLVLPEDGLITVRPVTNTPNQNPTSPTASFPVPTDDPTIYSGLIQQSNYHRMANDIYRRVLSSPTVTPQLVNSFEKMIQNWHSDNPAACARLVSGSMEQWKLTAWRRQFLCDQSLHLLIHRPLLLQWLQNKDINKDTALPAEEHAAEAQCRAAGLAIARETIAQISESIMEGTYDKMTLAFTL
ncbi:hypothetical protein PENANT_c001G05873 [Penicillium antarcticum]|uniref:Xylanolytic transcriptional activator regulatory domain-containing protein n=2 Tax=Penicillium antarcticum TaxID=416450 RepID=A0A1V6QPG8_9EURO|nr:hypothetical protein PENANT_c001G05873 [Penicillium antarcticum]